jgi:DNA-binding transcriptional LysR family regulator
MSIQHPRYVLRYIRGESVASAVFFLVFLWPMSVELAQWRLFLAVADEGSLNRAAVHLAMDQPALSRAVRRLELAVGTPLFIRSRGGTTLTASGAKLVEQARSLVVAADALEAAAHAEARSSARVLRVGAPEFYALTAALANASRALRALDPPVRIDLLRLPWTTHLGAVLNRTIDVGFALIVDHRLPVPDVLLSTPLRAERQAYALLPAGHPLAGVDIVDPRALAAEPLHLPSRDDNPDLYDLALELLADSGVSAPHLAPPYDSTATVVQYVASGHGWAMMTGNIGRYPPAGTISRPLDFTVRRQVHLEIVWHRDTDATAVRALTDHLLATPELTFANEVDAGGPRTADR